MNNEPMHEASEEVFTPTVMIPQMQSTVSTHETSTSIAKLAEALAKAQGVMEGADKDTKNSFYNSKYADLASVYEACRKPLSDNGLSVVQLASANRSTVYVTTLLMHSSGEYIKNTLTMTAMKQVNKEKGGGWEIAENPQSIGSAITYARRYALMAMVGIAPEDDDGEGAEGRGANGGNGNYNRQSAPPPKVPKRDPNAPKINEEQLAELGELIVRSKVNANNILNLHKIEKLADLTVPEFDELKTSLEKRAMLIEERAKAMAANQQQKAA